MTATAISTRYANALVDVVTSPKAAVAPQQALGELKSFAQALAASPELHNALESPAVPPARKRAVVTRIADLLGLSRVPRNFLYVLIDHRRIASLEAILGRSAGSSAA